MLAAYTSQQLWTYRCRAERIYNYIFTPLIADHQSYRILYVLCLPGIEDIRVRGLTAEVFYLDIRFHVTSGRPPICAIVRIPVVDEEGTLAYVGSSSTSFRFVEEYLNILFREML